MPALGLLGLVEAPHKVFFARQKFRKNWPRWWFVRFVVAKVTAVRLRRSYKRNATADLRGRKPNVSRNILNRSFSAMFRALNRVRVWHSLPFPLAVANLVALRADLRAYNLHGTERAKPEPPDPRGFDFRRNRTPDGSFNDLSKPTMGRAGTRFGRNVPIALTYRENDEAILDPNPRLISRKLLTRHSFTPVPHLNVLAAGWLQFMVHDWFSHEGGVRPDDPDFSEEERRPFKVPLAEDDDWHERPLEVRKTTPNPETGPADEGKPATFRNTESHWWDASQIYGSSQQRIDRIRSGPHQETPAADGKIHLENGHLPLETIAGENLRDGQVELAGVNGNWWAGISILHTLFAREHNAICDHLKTEYPDKNGEWLFQKARLIIAALLAKIHTVEWTPALLNTPTLRFGMRGQWWGVLGEEFIRGYGRIGRTEVASGIIESDTDHHSADYSITEEFVAVYRMHSLLPDEFDLRRHVDNTHIEHRNLLEISGQGTHHIYENADLADVFYSMGTEHPGALVLNNFPKHLQTLRKQVPSSRTVDVATIDILRDRERGVPRYCEFRRQLRMSVPKTFTELVGADRADLAAELEAIYGKVEKVDLLIGTLAEKDPEGFGFSDTAFRIFIVMASRRLKSDRFYTSDYNAETYTQVGLDWIADNSLNTVLLRHIPTLGPRLAEVKNAFFPWHKAG